jgi:hypothetical protein
MRVAVLSWGRWHAVASIGIAVAACGGAAVPSSPGATPAVPAASAAPDVTAGADAGHAEAPTTPASTLPGAGAIPLPAVDMKSPVPTAMVRDLQAIGLDAGNLPPIGKLEPKALRRVMKLLTKSLGAQCRDCHQEGDFGAPTRRKKIAAKMWDEMAVRLSMADGSPLFCDSCHQGRIVQLDRRDKKALGSWMDANFVDKLKRKDGGDHGCETCHVGMEMTFLTKWGGSP